MPTMRKKRKEKAKNNTSFGSYLDPQHTVRKKLKKKKNR